MLGLQACSTTSGICGAGVKPRTSCILGKYFTSEALMAAVNVCGVQLSFIQKFPLYHSVLDVSRHSLERKLIGVSVSYSFESVTKYQLCLWSKAGPLSFSVLFVDLNSWEEVSTSNGGSKICEILKTFPFEQMRLEERAEDE